MSKKNYTANGVPWYSSTDLPAIRPREFTIPETPDWKANQMAARQYVLKAVKEGWKAGDRFFVTKEKRRYYCFLRKEWDEGGSKHAGHTGTFRELKLFGYAYFVMVDWDDPDYRPNGLGKNKVGLHDFYHFAFPLET